MSNKIPEPLSVQEQYLHGILIRMDALCNMMSAFIKAYAEQNDISTERQVVEEKVPRKKKEVSEHVKPKTTKRKG